MKSESEKLKLQLVFGGLIIAALCINFFFYRQRSTVEESKQQQQLVARQAYEASMAAKQRDDEAAAAKRKAIEDAAAEHAKFLTTYLNRGISRAAGVKTVAIAVASENGKVNRAIRAALTDRLKTNTVQILDSFLKPEFVTDGLLYDTFNDETKLPDQLELTNALDALFVARQTIRYSENPALENVATAEMRLEVLLLPIFNRDGRKTWMFSASGAGFRQDDARTMAEERILKQIASDTNMSFGLLFKSKENQ